MWQCQIYMSPNLALHVQLGEVRFDDFCISRGVCFVCQNLSSSKSRKKSERCDCLEGFTAL